jgi:hypothetical protein
MSPTDPYTGSPIPPGVDIVKCPKCHNINRLDSWNLGNKCKFPYCDYHGDPIRINQTEIAKPQNQERKVISISPTDTSSSHDKSQPNRDANPLVGTGTILFFLITIAFVFAIISSFGPKPEKSTTLFPITQDPTTPIPTTQVPVTSTPIKKIEDETVSDENQVNQVVDEPTQLPEKANDLSFNCPDIERIRIHLGENGIVSWPKVNLRSDPRVPQDYYENIIIALDIGVKFSVIGGPTCSHNGTWWKIETKSGYSGWIRELTDDGFLISPIQ